MKKLIKHSALADVEEQLGDVKSLDFENATSGSVLRALLPLSHNVAKAELALLTEAMGQPSIQLEGAVHVGTANASMAWGDAMALIDMQMRIRDVALTALALAPMLEAPVGTITVEHATKKLGSMSVALGAAVADL